MDTVYYDCLKRIATAFERMADASEATLAISARSLAVQEQMASSSKALEQTLALGPAGTGDYFKCS